MFAIFQKWHRNVGIITALFVIFLVISGIALNHSDGLSLNTRHIKSDWILDLYKIKPINAPISFNEKNNWVTQIDQRIYFNEQEIAKDIEQLFGVLSIDDYFVVATTGQLMLITREGDVIERLSGSEGVPAGMRAIGLSENNDVIIKAAHGFYQVSLDDLEWQEFDHLDASWSEPSPIKPELEQALLKQYRGSGLSVERVLLDFHSGRIVGEWGVYLVDIAAILFLLLALSGCWMWWMRR